MNGNYFRAAVFLLLAGMVWSVLPVLAQSEGDVEIFRDDFGVPHIYGRTIPAVGYGFGYAQAEDHLEKMLRVILEGNGRMAQALGEPFVQQDVRAALFRFRAIGVAAYKRLPADVRAYKDAFADGINRYMRDHPDRTPDWARPLTGEDIMTYEWSLLIKYPLNQAMAELNAATGRPRSNVIEGSNALAINGVKSATGRPMLLIDPHLPWAGPVQWYEAHLNGPGLHVAGASFFGVSVISIGHNEEYAWAFTNNGLDNADVYEEKIHPDDPNRYRDGDAWLTMDVVDVTLDVKTPEGMRTVSRTLRYTKRGPVVERGGAVYSLALGFWDQPMNPARDYRQATGATLADFRNAVGLMAMPKWNVVYADRAGNIYYTYTGRVPRRDPAFDWTRPVPGWDPRTAWQGFHPLQDMPQITNPTSHTLVQCNNNPFTVTPEQDLNPDDFPDYMVNKNTHLSLHTRAGRMQYLLDQQPSFTFEQLQELSLDVYAIDADRSRQLLLNAWDRRDSGMDDPGGRMAQAVHILRDWDLMATHDSRAIPILGYWYAAIRKATPGFRLHMVAPDDSRQQEQALAALGVALKTMQSQYGTIAVPKRQVHGIRRGDRFFPVEGVGNARSLLPFTSLFMSGANQFENGRWYANQGSSFMMLISLEDRIRAVSLTPLGQSEDPASPHYYDGPQQFSKRQYKPAWFYKEDVLRHAKKTVTLSMSG